MKKGFLIILILFMFLMVGCQKVETYTLISDSYKDHFFCENTNDAVYTVMLGERDNRLVLLALKLENDTFKVYRTYQLPNMDGDIKIVHYTMDNNHNPYVYLSINGITEEFKATKRVSLTGHYYVMEKHQGFVDGFNVTVNNNCFGDDNPCPFNSQKTAFIEGPYLDYLITDLHVIYARSQKRLHSELDQWFILNGEDTIYRVLALHDQTLYQIIVKFMDGEIVYTTTLLDDDVVFAKEINDSGTMLILHNNSTYHFTYWDLSESSLQTFEGDFIEYHYYNPNYVIETTSHFYIFNEMIRTHQIEKKTTGKLLSIHLNSSQFGYYYFENNTIKYFHQSI
ncbi:MAG: hypothetical protein EOM50_22435 [Erysipelotrichia bacterium]|nr:hypothetical protein [Erysipelotrichia bacterium]